MSGNKANEVTRNIKAGFYAVCIKEQIKSASLVWFEEYSIQNTEQGETIITGIIEDQSALHGLLARIRDLNLTLISVNPILEEK